MKQLDAAITHSVWSAALPPLLSIEPGETIRIATSLGSGARYRAGATTPADILEATRTSPGLALTGPIHIAGSEPGDVLDVELLELVIDTWGYTTIAPGFGLLSDDFPDPAFRQWDLSDGRAAPFDERISVPLEPFLGAVGVAPPEGQVLSTIPPTRWGGNLDVRQMRVGSTIFLPVAVPGALLSLGDAHGAQGDGEVCGTAIETSALASVRVTLHKGWRLAYPAIRTSDSSPSRAGPAYVTTGIGPDLYGAAQEAVRGMIDYLGHTHHLSREDAYILSSVAVDLRISEIVDRPNWVVSASIPLRIFGP